MRMRNQALAAALSLAVFLSLAFLSTTSQAMVAAPVSISLSTSSAYPGDLISISGQDVNPVEGDCVLAVRKGDGKGLDNGVIDGSCSAESDGNISGSFD